MIHIQTYSSGHIYITDMQNAQKRGKTAQRLSYCGDKYRFEPDSPQARAVDAALALVQAMPEATPYADAVTAIKTEIIKHNIYGLDDVYEATIRGIDCPLPVLTAGIPGKWSGQIDNDGVHLADLTDRNNDPRVITHHTQADTRAYALAAKVWDAVKAAATMGEASRILSAAGCRLHYYCAMD